MSSADPAVGPSLYLPAESLLPRPFEISGTQQGAYVYLTVIIGIVLAGLTVGVKLHLAISTYHQLRHNDLAIVVALVGVPSSESGVESDR